MNLTVMRKTLELLAPAKDADTGIAAIRAGADAIYIGGPSHGARAAAGNSVEDIRRLCDFAHIFRARVYVTLNTLIYDDELEQVEKLVRELYAAGVDALIVQDMALLRMKLPPIALHASTQCDTRTPEKAEFLARAGFSQIVLPREFTLDEIRAVAERVEVPLEAFVHGALCVCYSGDCRASLVSGGRSANRGECAQICRLPYDLVDGEGRVLVADRHLLSLRDLKRIDDLEEMADAGVRSFKIEGRLKGKSYVMNVVRAYSEALDALCARRPGDYCRQSAGIVESDFEPDVNKTFNRGYTEFFLREPRPKTSDFASTLTPKFVGNAIGTVANVKGNVVTLRPIEKGAVLPEIANGDGLGWFDRGGRFDGARVNRAEGNRIILLRPVDIPVGTKIYRNFDKMFEDALESSTISRYLPVDITLRTASGMIVADIADPLRGLSATVSADCNAEASRSPQENTQREIFSRLGGTCYRLNEFTTEAGDIFIPRSVLTSLRRAAVDSLDKAAAATMPLDLRRPENHDAPLPPNIHSGKAEVLTFHDNVANRLAEKFYREHGAKEIAPAMETDMPSESEEVRVMTTRYCLRREMGACLRTAGAGKLPSTLFLRPKNSVSARTMRIDFDCAVCCMHLTALPLE